MCVEIINIQMSVIQYFPCSCRERRGKDWRREEREREEWRGEERGEERRREERSREEGGLTWRFPP